MLLKNTLNLARHSMNLPRIPLRRQVSPEESTAAPAARAAAAPCLHFSWEPAVGLVPGVSVALLPSGEVCRAMTAGGLQLVTAFASPLTHVDPLISKAARGPKLPKGEPLSILINCKDRSERMRDVSTEATFHTELRDNAIDMFVLCTCALDGLEVRNFSFCLGGGKKVGRSRPHATTVTASKERGRDKCRDVMQPKQLDCLIVPCSFSFLSCSDTAVRLKSCKVPPL